jgi:hypothetical protein
MFGSPIPGSGFPLFHGSDDREGNHAAPAVPEASVSMGYQPPPAPPKEDGAFGEGQPARDSAPELFPEGLQLSGEPPLAGCTEIARLPEGLRVGGELSLVGCTEIARLPEGLQVSGALDLTGSAELLSLPSLWSVGHAVADEDGVTAQKGAAGVEPRRPAPLTPDERKTEAFAESVEGTIDAVAEVVDAMTFRVGAGKHVRRLGKALHDGISPTRD